MRYLIAFLLVFNFISVFAQGPRFQFYRNNACDNIERLDTTYSLSIGDTSFHPKNGIVYLPSKGDYSIWFDDDGPLLDTTFSLPDTGLVIFRYKEPKVLLYFTRAVDSPPFYASCGKALNGYVEDFYDSGMLKMRGTFNRGYFKDSLVFFYPNGIIKKSSLRKNTMVHYIYFDSTGHIVREFHRQDKSFISYADSHEVDYFPDGKIKRRESSVKHIERIDEFYPTGKRKTRQTKSIRDEYFENGRLNISYRWKKHEDSFIIDKKEYNDSGQLLKATVYDYWADEYIKQPRLNIAESNWIISVTTYSGEKKTIIVEDVETADYLKNYPQP